MDTQDIKKMSASERIKAMEALWDSLIYEDGEIETPQWHKDILEHRKDRINSGKAKFISLAELKKIHK